MTAPWFFAPPEDWAGDRLTLPPDESHHALRVLRISAPDVITVTDGRGTVARCALTGEKGGRVTAEVLEREETRPLKPEMVVYQGAAKGTKVDSMVERLAELGVAELWVYESERAVVRWDEAKMTKHADRWRSIARSAAKQARSPYMLHAAGGLSFTELRRRLAKEDVAVVLWEEASLPLRTALVEPADRVALVIGPEGGLTRAEAEELADSGGQLVSLGPRILRTENAAVVAVTSLLYHYGLIG